MFDGLRKKLKDAISGFAKHEEKIEEAQPEAVPEAPEEPAAEEEEAVVEEATPAGEETTSAEEPQPAEEAAPVEESAPIKEEEPVAEKAEPMEEAPQEEAAAPVPVPAPAERHEPEKPKIAEKHGTQKIDLKLTTKIKSAFLGKITLSDSEIDKFVDGLKEPMLRSDVAYGTVEELAKDIRAQLAGKQIRSRSIDAEVTNAVRDALMQVLEGTGAKSSLEEMVDQRLASGEKPVKILFLGPNGAGKTTTIAKLAHTFKGKGMSAVVAASDTFRAAAIEQLEMHAKRIGVQIIKSKYGADPASVAFDAIAHAKANGMQLVLIDSAGRQETNASLIGEIEKMVRVCKPDITVFIGESTAGNVIAEQISEFGRHVHIDGIILTKLDCDAKGGSALSIAKVTGVPVLYFGTGESYDALMPYSSEFVVNAVLPAS